jgi:uncharacterized membrane protein
MFLAGGIDMNKVIKTTVLGGIVFLIPIVLMVAIIDKAFSMMHLLATPLLEFLPIESIFGAATAHVVTVIILILFCFVAGLFARTNLADRFGASLEKNLLEKIPTYVLIRAKLRSVLQPEELEKLHPVMVRFDDSWQFALEVEKIHDDKVLVFLPGAPDAWSGSVCVVTDDRVERMDIDVQAVNLLMKRLGEGSSQALVPLKFGQPLLE